MIRKGENGKANKNWKRTESGFKTYWSLCHPKTWNFDFCPHLSKNVLKLGASGKKHMLSYCKCLFEETSRELIWPIYWLKISKYQKMCFWWKDPGGNGLRNLCAQRLRITVHGNLHIMDFKYYFLLKKLLYSDWLRAVWVQHQCKLQWRYLKLVQGHCRQLKFIRSILKTAERKSGNCQRLHHCQKSCKIVSDNFKDIWRTKGTAVCLREQSMYHKYLV